MATIIYEAHSICAPFRTTSMVSLIFPIMLSQITVLKANKHVPPSVGTLVQVTVVWLVVVGQLPQFDARML